MRTTRVGFPAILAIALTMVMSVCSPRNAGGQPQSLSLGTVQKVTDYAVSKANAVSLGMWAYDTNGQKILYYSGGWQTGQEGYFTNKLAMDRFVAGQMAFVFQNFLTNTAPILNPDKGKGMTAYVYWNTIVNGFGEGLWYLFYTPSNILIKPVLVKGVYTVPDMSGFSTALGGKISFYIPNLKWARLEVSNRGNQTPFEIIDSRNDDPNNQMTSLIDSQGFLELPTDIITNSSSLNGAYTLKLSVFADTFRSFDGDGNALPETPLRLSMEKTGVITT
ncbi:MAG: hypothetical protein KGI23_02740, partial [Patescibacteria group bacterium]|nr:hypothetical protein [Patescibacteria group bacterium]